MLRRSPLWTPLTLGTLTLPNRILMAPMTRNRATAEGLPTPSMVTYYRQRASAGLIISEMTQVSPTGRSYQGTPGVHSAAQAAAWRSVTDAVHASGGRLFVQISHGGRVSHPLLQPHGERPVAPSAIAPDGVVSTSQGPQPFLTPRALEAHELPGIVEEFAAAAGWAREAGFDGVELHSANGYLLDQFLRDGANQRSDAYGGSPAGRARLLLEVVEAVSAVVGPDRTGVRLSPFNPYNSMSDSAPRATFTHVAAALRPFGLAYLHVVEPLGGDDRLTPEIRRRFEGPVIANGGFAREPAEAALERGEADAVSFAAAFLANPDLPWRLAIGAPLTAADAATFYTGGDRGYIDYPPLATAA